MSSLKNKERKSHPRSPSWETCAHTLLCSQLFNRSGPEMKLPVERFHQAENSNTSHADRARANLRSEEEIVFCCHGTVQNPQKAHLRHMCSHGATGFSRDPWNRILHNLKVLEETTEDEDGPKQRRGGGEAEERKGGREKMRRTGRDRGLDEGRDKLEELCLHSRVGPHSET